MLTSNYNVFCIWSVTRLPGKLVFFWVTDLLFLIFRFCCCSSRNSLSSGRMFPTCSTCLTTNLSWYLPSLKQCSHREAYRSCSWSNSCVQVLQHTKSRWAISWLFPVFFHVRLGKNHVHSYREHPAYCDLRQDLEGTLHPTGGSLRWRKCDAIRVWCLRVLTHKECFQLCFFEVEEECFPRGNLLAMMGRGVVGCLGCWSRRLRIAESNFATRWICSR